MVPKTRDLWLQLRNHHKSGPFTGAETTAKSNDGGHKK